MLQRLRLFALSCGGAGALLLVLCLFCCSYCSCCCSAIGDPHYAYAYLT